jgi:hypothetical protein
MLLGHKILFWKPESKRPLHRLIPSWEYIIKTVFKVMELHLILIQIIPCTLPTYVSKEFIMIYEFI